MTGYTVHTGSSEKFASGWDQIFSGKPKGKSGAKTKAENTAKPKAEAKAKKGGGAKRGKSR